MRRSRVRWAACWVGKDLVFSSEMDRRQYLLSHRKLHEGGFAAGQAFEGHGFFAGGAELVTGAFFPLRGGDAFPGPAQRV